MFDLTIDLNTPSPQKNIVRDENSLANALNDYFNDTVFQDNSDLQNSFLNCWKSMNRLQITSTNIIKLPFEATTYLYQNKTQNISSRDIIVDCFMKEDDVDCGFKIGKIGDLMIKNAKPMTQILTNKSKKIVTKAYFFKATDAYKNPIMLHLLKEVFYQKLAFDAFENARKMGLEGLDDTIKCTAVRIPKLLSYGYFDLTNYKNNEFKFQDNSTYINLEHTDENENFQDVRCFFIQMEMFQAKNAMFSKETKYKTRISNVLTNCMHSYLGENVDLIHNDIRNQNMFLLTINGKNNLGIIDFGEAYIYKKIQTKKRKYGNGRSTKSKKKHSKKKK